MSNYATLIASIQSVITQNGNNEITGTILQQTLLSMINSLGSGYQFVGIATPETNPGTPDQRVFYLASSGTYPNFGPATIPAGNLAVLYYDASWHYSLCETTAKFASGEEVNETYIDDTHLANPKSGALAKSDDILNLPNPSFNDIDFTDVQTINFTIGISSGNWAKPTNANSAIIPVHAGSTIHIATIGNRSAQYGFLSSYPTPVVGESAPLVDGLYFLKTTSFPETERTQIVPQNAKYIYVKLKEGTANYTPTLQIKAQKFLVESDIVDNLDSENPQKALSARQGSEIKRIKNSLNAITTPSLEGNTFDAVIGISTLNWIIGGNNARCAIITVNAGDTLHIEAESSLNYVQYGYLTEKPNPVNGESAHLLDGLHYLNSTSFPQLETTEIIPELAKYLYIKLADGTYNHTPKNVEITPTKVTYDYIDDVIEYDSYIEENILRYESSLAYNRNRIKLYKIDPKINYKLILRVRESTTGNVEYLDENLQLIGTEFDSDTSELLKMVDMNIPQNCAYIRIKCYISNVSSGTYTYRGCGAIMKPITNSMDMPTNETIFCVSKLKYPVMPYNYSEEVAFEQSDIWSAWAFMLPYNVNSLHGKKLPLVAFFHGSSGFVTSEYMGYNAAVTRDGIVGSLRSKGFVVFDVNGYGISYDSDDFSKHWGCPLSVLTAKKAYEILTSIFNCRKGMIISGISMGGAIAKSYCMAYPNDTIGCALEAPSEMGMTARFSPGETVWKAWGYDSAQDMLDDTNRNAFIGCSPLIKPLYKDTYGNVKAMSEVMDFSTQNAMYSNINNFIGGFPVEIKIWHGDADNNVDLRYSQLFVNTVRNANGLATLRLCPNCTHNLNEYPWVMQEVIDYITDKLKL